MHDDGQDLARSSAACGTPAARVRRMLLDQAQGHADQSDDGFRHGAVGDEIAGKHAIRERLELLDNLSMAEPACVVPLKAPPPASCWCPSSGSVARIAYTRSRAGNPVKGVTP